MPKGAIWFSDRNMMIQLPRNDEFSSPFEVAVATFCGPVQFTYRWGRSPGDRTPFLVNDTRLVTVGPKTIELVEQGHLEWRASSGKYEFWPEISSDRSGRTIALVLTQ